MSEMGRSFTVAITSLREGVVTLTVSFSKPADNTLVIVSRFRRHRCHHGLEALNQAGEVCHKELTAGWNQ
jgi:hypothetical protein